MYYFCNVDLCFCFCAAETGGRVGPFDRSSYSPQSSGQRVSCCWSPWCTFCSHSPFKTQWWGHTLSDQGEIVRNEVLKKAWIHFLLFHVFIDCVCRTWQRRWVVLWLRVIQTLFWVRLSNYASHSETWPHCRKAAGSTMRYVLRVRRQFWVS